MNLKLCSVMCAPLMAQGELLGMLYVGNDNVVNLFEESSLDVLSIFAGQASLILQNALLVDSIKTDFDALKQQLDANRFGDIIGACPSMRDVFRTVEKVAGADISVLITGETGTGKELIARAVHQRSPRKDGPFIVVNCGAIPENLIESELFGHVRGAFTGAVATRPGKFQQAHNGTLFLDEVGELPLALQVKLLRALQEKVVMKVGDTKPEHVDIRIVAATNRDLEDEMKNGTFREDLFYRLNVINIHLPPLRERGDDVLVIAKYLLAKYAEEYGSKVKGFTPNALIAIRKYDWPGNVRQLENRIKKAIVMCDKTLIGVEDLDMLPEASGTHDHDARASARGLSAPLHPRGARAQQRQPHQDRAGPGRRSAHDLPLPGARVRAEAHQGQLTSRNAWHRSCRKADIDVTASLQHRPGPHAESRAISAAYWHGPALAWDLLRS